MAVDSGVVLREPHAYVKGPMEPPAYVKRPMDQHAHEKGQADGRAGGRR
ncbi:hypothetical protein [Streptomyces sp. NPDC052114]